MVGVAILGFGVVGTGVAEVLAKHGSQIAEKVEASVEVKYILARREYPESPFKELVVQDFSVIESDPEVKVVAECIGGVGDALDYTRRALKAGKSVVSSNKELVAEHGFELLELAVANNVSYLFEASVGGGIPVLRPLTHCLGANALTEIAGILNGTTNYILTRMIQAGLSFEAALDEAQKLGYAEQDPTADVEGHDACRKICILAAIAFGRHIYPNQVETQGITQVSLADVALAGSKGYKIKLLGRAVQQGNGKVCAYVAPHLVDESLPLANVVDVFNAVAVKGDAIGEVMFYGRGAGKLPTASAVVADVMDAVRHTDASKRVQWADGGLEVTENSEKLASKWYVRGKHLTPVSGAEWLEVDGVEEKAMVFGTMTQGEILERLGGQKPGVMFRIFE